MPPGHSAASTVMLPAGSRVPCHQPSSMFTYWYPAAFRPLETIASACPLITLKLILAAKLFHEAQPMGGPDRLLALPPAPPAPPAPPPVPPAMPPAPACAALPPVELPPPPFAFPATAEPPALVPPAPPAVPVPLVPGVDPPELAPPAVTAP